MKLHELDRLRFRRQFILAPQELKLPPEWQRARVAGELHLHVHPDLELVQSEHDGCELTLLGFIIDPERSDATNTEICERLVRCGGSVENLASGVHRLGGRWILLLATADRLFVLNDPCALRQLFYCIQGAPWCASQPEMLRHFLPLQPNREASDDLTHTRFLNDVVERWWPGYDSPYEGVRQLPPNHYVELRAHQIRRFWPTGRIARRRLDPAAREAADLLQRLIVAGAKRFPLALAMTAGMDSRALLAATRPVRDRLFCYTLKYNSLMQKAIDLDLPQRLLGRLGLSHSVIECPARMDEDFAGVFRQNVTLAHEAYGPIAQGVLEHYPQERVCLKGSCSEIARSFYYPFEYPPRIDGENLAMLAGMRRNRYAQEQFDRWLRKASPLCQRCGIEVLDLFYWEQKMANWQATSQTEFDIAQEEFTPFNCRALLETLLGTSPRFRRPPYKLYRRIIEHLWPEALCEPINPRTPAERMEERVTRMRYLVRCVLQRLRIFGAVKRLLLLFRRVLPASAFSKEVK